MRVVLLLVASLLAVACDDEPEPTPPDVIADVATLRTIVNSDPAVRPLEEIERVAGDRPVLGARMLQTGALPAARRQVARVREATVTSPEGRSLARRMMNAYEQRVRGLEQWHAYLEDAATNDAELLESLTTRREAQTALLGLDQEMEAFVPTELPRAPRGAPDEDEEAAPEGAQDPEEPESPY